MSSNQCKFLNKLYYYNFGVFGHRQKISFSRHVVSFYTHKNGRNNNNNRNNGSGFGGRRYGSRYFALGALSGLAAAPVVLSDEKDSKSSTGKNSGVGGKRIEGLPTYTLAQVEKHKTMESGVWVIFHEGVYDVTEFVENHPGGSTIMLAAGGDVIPYWKVYAQHFTKQVFELMEEYRIGNLDRGDIELLKKKSVKADDQYASDPDRNPALIVRQQKPFNAETPPMLAVKSNLTPQSLFFVRNHMPVPDLDPKTYKLAVQIDEDETASFKSGATNVKSFTLDDLKTKYERITVEAAVQCSGNRRDDFNKFKEVKGLTWALTAISNGEWTGVRLRDVILMSMKEKGLSEDQLKSKFKHVHFEGYDCAADGTSYGSSIPLYKALDKDSEVVLAWQLNGETLSRDHGFPIRVVVPGTVGARSVKWLKSIKLSKHESNSHWQQKDYKMFSSSVDWHNVDWSKSPAVQECPVQCAICVPCGESFTLKKDEDFELEGYAYSGGGNGIIRVDVSLDGGKSWHQAELKPTKSEAPKEYGWRLWSFTVTEKMLRDAIGDKNEIEIVAKATDSSHNVMPSDPRDIWNLRGILNNSWHRVTFRVH